MCYTVVVALRKCDRGHPVIGSHPLDQQICWRQCHFQAVQDDRKKWRSWSICPEDKELDHTAYIPLVDDHAIAIRTADSCETCQLVDHSPEVQSLQTELRNEQDSVERVRADIRNLYSELRVALTQADAEYLEKAIDVEERLFAHKAAQVLVLKGRLEQQRKNHVVEGDRILVAHVKEQRRAMQESGADEGTRAYVYFGRQSCERERLDMKRSIEDDWPEFFPPPEKLEAYIEDGQPAIVPLRSWTG